MSDSSSVEALSIISVVSSDEEHLQSLGHRVWTIGHLRAAILEGLPRSQQLQLLTLSHAYFPDVARALYHTVNFGKFLGNPLPPWTPTYRIDVYRQSVRVIDLTASLPACVGFAGGLPRLLEVFPLLKGVDLHHSQRTLSFTRYHVDGEVRNEIVIKSNIFAGSGNSARLARYHHCLPKDWNVVVTYDLSVHLFDRFSRSVENTNKIRSILLQPIKSLRFERGCGGMALCDECSTPYSFKPFHPLERMMEARRNSKSPPITTLVLDKQDYTLTLPEFESVSVLCGKTVQRLTAAVTIPFTIPAHSTILDCEGGPHAEPITTLSLADILATFDWSVFESLHDLTLRLYILIDDWPSATWLCYPVGHDHAVHLESKPPLYVGPHLNLRSFDLELCFVPESSTPAVPRDIRVGIHGDDWIPGYLPDTDDLVRAVTAISGPSCKTSVKWAPWYDCEFDGVEELEIGSSIYNYLLKQSLKKARHSGVRGWKRKTAEAMEVQG